MGETERNRSDNGDLMNFTESNCRRCQSVIFAFLVSASPLIATAAAEPALHLKRASADVETESRITDMPGVKMGTFVR